MTPEKILMLLQLPAYLVIFVCAYNLLFKKKTEDTKPVLDMTKTEYEDALALCISWIEIESKLVGTTREEIASSAFYNMATFNLCRLDDVDKVFKVTDAQRTLVRLVQLYLNVCFRYGKKKVDTWSYELQVTLINLGQNGEMVKECFKEHPYLVLLPALNIAASTKYAKKF